MEIKPNILLTTELKKRPQVDGGETDLAKPKNKKTKYTDEEPIRLPSFKQIQLPYDPQPKPNPKPALKVTTLDPIFINAYDPTKHSFVDLKEGQEYNCSIEIPTKALIQSLVQDTVIARGEESTSIIHDSCKYANKKQGKTPFKSIRKTSL